MKMIIRHFILLLSLPRFINRIVNAQQKPTIMYIPADDVGYGDFSCYGQQKINNPKLDKLASQGMQFMQHYGGLQFVNYPDTL
jgi:hypothetical protein